MADNQYLWTFQEFDRQSNMVTSKFMQNIAPSVGPAPMLKPEMTNDDIFQLISKRFDSQSYTVNVVKDYPWTLSPQNAESIGDVPELHLRENMIEYNPLINQMMVNLASIGQDASTAVETAKDVLQSIQALGGETVVGVKQDKASGSRKETIAGKAIRKLASAAGNNFLDTVGNKLRVPSIKDLLKNTLKSAKQGREFDVMNPYKNLYTTRHTGWKYKLPWFNNQFRSVSNNFGGTASGGGIPGTIANTIAGIAGQIASGVNFFEPGSYIEQPKPFNFGGEKSYSISFPLLNTTSYEELVRNWQLIFLLVYQNQPNRITRSLILPPVIYEALVPGVWYSNFTYISNLSISYIGSTRKMKIRLPSLTKNVLDDFLIGFTDLTTVVPDAYNVDITFTELFPEAQNHMYSALTRRNLNSKVRTGEIGQGQGAGTFLKDLGSGVGNFLKNLGRSDEIDSAPVDQLPVTNPYNSSSGSMNA